MTTETKVGAFVLAGLAVLAGTIYFVRTTQTVRGQVPFKTYFRYAGGLAPGATVLFGGIKVGQVVKVGPSPADPTRIEILFEVMTGTPVNEKSLARVSTVSVMSSPALSLTTGTNEARRLRAGEVVPSEEMVNLEEALGRIAALADSATRVLGGLERDLPAITGEARTLLTNLNQISGTRNQRRIEGILAELNTLLARESPKIAQITSQLSELARHADALVGSAQPVVANVNETVAAVREPLRKDLAELERTLADARAVLAGVQTIVRVNEGDIAETVRNLRYTSESVRALSESLRQRPFSLIRTTQPPDRKVPR